MTGTASFGPGAITLAVRVERERDGLGRVADVRIASTRPVGFSTALFVNRPADEIPALVGRLHALCGLSHATASAAAIAAARGEDAGEIAAERFEGLIAERLGEHLRSIFLGPSGLAAGEAPRDTLADLRAVLASARGLASVAGGPAGATGRGTASDQVARGLARLGLGLDRHGRLKLAAGSWAASVSARAGAASGDDYLAADPLRTEDDAPVVAALADDPLGFAALPRLGTRRPETGPFARAMVATGGGVFDGRGRLEARLAEIARAARLLSTDPAERRAGLGDWVNFGALDGHTGYAAVESPRGRLHHLARVDGAGRVAAYAILAPTEWNFGPDGPFVATLRANRLAPGSEGRARVERIAAAFDPCVGFAVEVEEAAHA